MAVGGGVSRIGVCRGGHVGVTGVGLLPPYFTLMKSTNNAPITQRKGPLFGLYRLTKLILIFSIIQFWYLWRGIEGFNFGDFSSPHQRLLSELFHNYDKRLQPIGENKFSKTVHINVTIVLGILIEMRENEQVAAYVISHIQRWRDSRLSWLPKIHSNITELIVPAKTIWQPKIFVYNSMDTKDMLNDEKYDARVKYNGQIKINIPQYVTCTCRLNIELFPFDTQFCAVALASPLLTVEEMEVHTSQPPLQSHFAGNSEWNLINVRPIFYITVIVVPIFLISTLSILGIFTPGSSDGPRGEKVSLGLGSLLAMTVLLGIVAGAMPKSNSIPLLGVYILVVILLCAISVAISMAFMASSKRYVEGARIPSQLTYKLSLVRPRIKRTKDLKRINKEEEGEGLLLNRGKSLREQLFIGGIRFTEPYMEEEGGEGGDCEENKNNYGSFGETKEKLNNKNGVLNNNNRRLSPKLEDNFNGDNKKRRATTTNIDISNIPYFLNILQ
uniref:Uncharacterized protein n=1 Tax=Meloidogyne enterolobii TaxID=390850 RepID=A0A6V7UXY8_MELEN|nr:unnamed protein product [Meloidogyne enterolobii]